MDVWGQQASSVGTCGPALRLRRMAPWLQPGCAWVVPGLCLGCDRIAPPPGGEAQDHAQKKAETGRAG